MDSLSVKEMQELQKELHRFYEDDWGELTPDCAEECLLWTIGEVGEVIDVIKKKGCRTIMNDSAVRSHFTEEVCDVLMHLTDFLISLGITSEEISDSFRAKQKRNLERWK